MISLIYVFTILGNFLALLNLPGPWFLVVATVLTNVANPGTVGGGMVALFVFLAIFASIADNILVLLGAKRFGASNWGMVGAVVGLIVGIIIGNLVGGIIGPFIGAYMFEYLIAKKESDKAFRAGIGTIFGLLASIIMKVGITVGMTIVLFSSIY